MACTIPHFSSAERMREYFRKPINKRPNRRAKGHDMSEQNDIGTPGPWQFQALKSGEYEICGMEYQDKIALCSAVAVAYTQPDAALIAAAPDLLELAKQIILAHEQEECAFPNDIVAGAYAALSKAKGTA